MSEPFFSAELLLLGPDGEYPSNHHEFWQSVSLTRRGVKLGRVLIDRIHIKELASDGPVLKLCYCTPSGSFKESYFLYSNFFDKTAKYTLRCAVDAATSAWAERENAPKS